MKKISLISLLAVVLLAGCSHQPTPVVDDTIDAEEEVAVVDGAEDEAPEEVVDGNTEVEEGVYTMDIETSVVDWKADRILSAGHMGTVSLKSGTATYANSRLVKAEAVIDMTTISSDGGEKLDGHLKNEDFFDVENYPEATITITNVEVVEGPDGESITATADLTIKGITNEVTFPVVEDEYGTTAKITIDRTLWDIKYGSEKFFDDLADKAIKDTIEFDVKIAYE